MAQQLPGPPYQSLFNGTDLSGWSVKCLAADSSKEYFRADNGTLLIESQSGHDYMWLYSDQEYTDFIFKCEFQAYRTNNGNSGVQIRSRYDHNDGGGWLNGPQIDIHPVPPETYRIGYVYDETRGYQRWIYPDAPGSTFPEGTIETPEINFIFSDEGEGWNSMEISVIGMQYRTIVNGVTVTDWNADGVLNDQIHKDLNVGETGHIAIQLHTGDILTIRYRNIYIYDITGDVTPPEALSGFMAIPMNEERIDLLWASVIDEGADSISICYNTDGTFPSSPGGAAFCKDLAASLNMDSLTGLSPGTEYSISAFVKDLAGNWSQGANVLASTQGASIYWEGNVIFPQQLEINTAVYILRPDGALVKRLPGDAASEDYFLSLETGLYFVTTVSEGKTKVYKLLVY
jgi:hypothetical protein